MIDITGLNKAKVLAALTNHVLKMRNSTLLATVEDAEHALRHYNDDVDYFYGVAIKIDFSHNEIDDSLYDRDVRPGAAASVIAELRAKHGSERTTTTA